MGVMQYIELGGVMMWPLLACSVLLGGVLFERLVTVVLLKRCCEPDTHRRVLAFFTDVPPAIGLLGTVIGVVQSFQLTEGRVSGENVAAGLAIACMTTIFGLSIALVATLAGYVLELALPTERPS
jgi:biopolymer transport protein ExbB/TolQ